MKIQCSVLFALLVGCNTFETIDEACLGEIPGMEAMSDPDDRAAALRLTCYRRLAKSNKVRIDEKVQLAVENHGAYLETNTPFLNLMGEEVGQPGYTGFNFLERLGTTGYVYNNNAYALSLHTVIFGLDDVVGADHFEVFFDDPASRGLFLQGSILHSGMASAHFTHTFPPDDERSPVPMSVMDYTFILSPPAVAVAEIPKIYPRNGQLDAPSSYVHGRISDVLLPDVVYGYPITFTVGALESGLVVEQSALIGGPNEDPLDFALLVDEDILEYNTVAMVPLAPLAPGNTYTAFMKITTDQGTRTAKSTFTVAADGGRPPFTGQARMTGSKPMPLMGRGDGFSLPKP